MSQKTGRIPSYRLHKGTGQAFVQVQGQRHYLGKYGTAASCERYRRFLAELEASAVRIAPAHKRSASGRQFAPLTIVELTAAYRRFAQGYYVQNGETTAHIYVIWRATELLAELYGRNDAASFGPSGLRAIQQKLIRDNRARKYINDICATIRRLFKWATSQELVHVTVYQALTTVNGLRRGRSAAREPEPVGPVASAAVDATLPHLPPVVADMVRFQQLVGCRPSEVCILRPCDSDTSGSVWCYTPSRHKCEHHDRPRRIYVGPKAQAILSSTGRLLGNQDCSPLATKLTVKVN